MPFVAPPRWRNRRRHVAGSDQVSDRQATGMPRPSTRHDGRIATKRTSSRPSRPAARAASRRRSGAAAAASARRPGRARKTVSGGAATSIPIVLLIATVRDGEPCDASSTANWAISTSRTPISSVAREPRAVSVEPSTSSRSSPPTIWMSVEDPEEVQVGAVGGARTAVDVREHAGDRFDLADESRLLPSSRTTAESGMLAELDAAAGQRPGADVHLDCGQPREEDATGVVAADRVRAEPRPAGAALARAIAGSLTGSPHGRRSAARKRGSRRGRCRREVAHHAAHRLTDRRTLRQASSRVLERGGTPRKAWTRRLTSVLRPPGAATARS